MQDFHISNTSLTLAVRLRMAELSVAHPSSSTDRTSPKPSRPTPMQTMSNLHHLPKTSTVVLFTPVLTPAASISTKPSSKKQPDSSSTTDPFETLGRSLASHHPRIRHVPYVPKIGFTPTHSAFMNQADAVIVVLCEPQTSKREILNLQFGFAEQTLETGSELPPILIQCGDFELSGWEDVLDSFEISLKCATLSSEIAKSISRKLFGNK